MNQAHTPTPWQSYSEGDEEGSCVQCPAIRDINGAPAGVAFCYRDSHALDAAHIVACVNAHDGLMARVAELEAMLRKLSNAVIRAKGEHAADGLAREALERVSQSATCKRSESAPSAIPQGQ